MTTITGHLVQLGVLQIRVSSIVMRMQTLARRDMSQPDQIPILDQLQSRWNLLRLTRRIHLSLDNNPMRINIRITVPTHDLLSGSSRIDLSRGVQVDITHTSCIGLGFTLDLDHRAIDDIAPGLDMVFVRVVRGQTVAVKAAELVEV